MYVARFQEGQPYHSVKSKCRNESLEDQKWRWVPSEQRLNISTSILEVRWRSAEAAATSCRERERMTDQEKRGEKDKRNEGG